MAHVQRKSARESRHSKESNPVEQSGKENQTRHDEKHYEAKVPRDVSQASTVVDEGGSWQFKFVLGVIALGVLILILKAVGLF